MKKEGGHVDDDCCRSSRIGTLEIQYASQNIANCAANPDASPDEVQQSLLQALETARRVLEGAPEPRRKEWNAEIGDRCRLKWRNSLQCVRNARGRLIEARYWRTASKLREAAITLELIFIKHSGRMDGSINRKANTG